MHSSDNECEECGSVRLRQMSGGLWKCAECGHYFSETTPSARIIRPKPVQFRPNQYTDE